MIGFSRNTAVLDACVLYPAPIRDLLLHIAAKDLYQPKWTAQIQGEWVRNLLLNRPDLSPAQLQKTVDAMNKAFPDAIVEGYELLIDALILPDPNDRHVLAAAIRSRANVLVTANLKDFPRQLLRHFDIDLQHPDEFIASMIEVDPAQVTEAFLAQVGNLKNPPKTVHQVIQHLCQSGLAVTAEMLLSLL